MSKVLYENGFCIVLGELVSFQIIGELSVGRDFCRSSRTDLQFCSAVGLLLCLTIFQFLPLCFGDDMLVRVAINP